MQKTIRTLGIASIFVAGLAGGSFAQSTYNSTSPSNPSNTAMTNTGQFVPRPNSTGNSVADSRGNTTTGSNIGSRTMQTGDGKVGPSAPSAGAKIGGGSGG
jgi:hypothetical protein